VKHGILTSSFYFLVDVKNRHIAVIPFVNKEGMQHMSQISQSTPVGRHTVVIIDGEG
jgi:hypothetical protein